MGGSRWREMCLCGAGGEMCGGEGGGGQVERDVCEEEWREATCSEEGGEETTYDEEGREETTCGEEGGGKKPHVMKTEGDAILLF